VERLFTFARNVCGEEKPVAVDASIEKSRGISHGSTVAGAGLNMVYGGTLFNVVLINIAPPTRITVVGALECVNAG
jgi:hypothetical protein